MSLAQQIYQAKVLGTWLYGRTNGRKLPDGIRERVGLAILQLTEDVLDAIIVLLEAQMPGPSWSLARPLFEGYVRGFWLLNCASDEQVNEFMNGRCPNFPKLLSAIPEDEESGGAWIHVNSDANLNDFHDLTHGGFEHVKRRLTDDTVEPSYPEHELVSLLQLGNEIRMRVGMELLSRLNDDEGKRMLYERAQVLRAES